MNRYSMRTIFTALTLTVAFVLLLLALAIFRLQFLNTAQVESNEVRYQSYLLADELRQSSDDLTRLARTYVVTGDPKWEEQYFEILAIRNGQSRRFENPERIIWDFKAAGQSVKRSNAQVALRDLMEQAGFTEEEFRFLNQAEDNSNQLVYTETVAMNAVKGLFEDSQGRFTVRGEPDQARAIRMMHDQAYHNEKARIMGPIDQFLAALDERTTAEVAAAAGQAQLWIRLTLGLSFLAFVCILAGLTLAWRYLSQVVGGEPKTVRLALNTLAKGHVKQPLAQANPDSVLGHAEQLRQKLYEVTHKIDLSAQSLSSTAVQLTNSTTQTSDNLATQVSQNEQVASAIEELSAAVGEVSYNITQAAATSKVTDEVVNRAVTDVEQSAKQTQTMARQLLEAENSVSQLSQDMASITEILEKIKGIADQTNLLALNAAIEAARAGEQGRGFAVVADEVRSLAKNSQEATEQISQSIDSLVQSSGQVSGVITQCSEQANQISEQANQTVGQLQEAVAKVASLSSMAEQIAAASEQQTATAHEVSHSVNVIHEASSSTQAEVEQVKRAALELNSMSDDLKQQVAYFSH